MSELGIKYLENGEWVYAQTGQYAGRLLRIALRGQKVERIIPQDQEKSTNESVIDLSEGQRWSPVISPHGSFEIFIPGSFPERLGRWMLTLRGLPRLYPALKMDAIERYFGPELPDCLEYIYTETAPYRESAGDLRVTEAAKGLRTLAEMQEEEARRIRTLIMPMVEPMPELAANRQALLDNAKWKSGQFIVSRTVFLK